MPTLVRVNGQQRPVDHFLLLQMCKIDQDESCPKNAFFSPPIIDSTQDGQLRCRHLCWRCLQSARGVSLRKLPMVIIISTPSLPHFCIHYMSQNDSKSLRPTQGGRCLRERTSVRLLLEEPTPRRGPKLVFNVQQSQDHSMWKQRCSSSRTLT